MRTCLLVLLLNGTTNNLIKICVLHLILDLSLLAHLPTFIKVHETECTYIYYMYILLGRLLDYLGYPALCGAGPNDRTSQARTPSPSEEIRDSIHGSSETVYFRPPSKENSPWVKHLRSFQGKYRYHHGS